MERTRDHAEEDTTFFPDWLTCAEGVLYCEDFDDTLAAWWDLDDVWRIVRQGSGYALRGNAYGWAWLTDHAWDNYRLRFRVRSPGGTLHINYRATPVTGGIRRYWVGFSEDGLYLHKSPGQGVVELAGVETAHQPNRWHEVELAAQGGRLQVYVDDKLELDYTDREPLTEGGVAFEMLSGQATIDDIEILPGKLLPPTRRPPTEAPPSEPECEVASVRLNLRGGPGTNYPILGAVTQGTRLTPLGRNPEATWLLVRVSATGQQGWVSGGSQYVRCNFPLVELPEVEIPAPPRPPPPPPTMPPPTSPPPTAPPPPPYVSCWVEPEVITQGGCATLGWDVRNVNQIYLDGNGVTGREDRQVCPYESRTYTLQVIPDAGVQYCSMQVQVVQVALAAPQQVSPPDGAVFYHVPRTTYLEWTAVPGAASYTVEIDCLLCCDPDQWCTDVGVTWGVFPGITATNYRHDFVGAQPDAGVFGQWMPMATQVQRAAGAVSSICSDPPRGSLSHPAVAYEHAARRLVNHDGQLRELRTAKADVRLCRIPVADADSVCHLWVDALQVHVERRKGAAVPAQQHGHPRGQVFPVQLPAAPVMVGDRQRQQLVEVAGQERADAVQLREAAAASANGNAPSSRVTPLAITSRGPVSSAAPSAGRCCADVEAEGEAADELAAWSRA